MKKDNRISSPQIPNSRVVVAATLLGLPLSVLPSVVEAQTITPPAAKTGYIIKMPALLFKFDKYPAQNTIIGINGDGHSVYRNAAGEYFSLDPKTGDLQFLSAKESAAFQRTHARAVKGVQQVTILGVDAKGNTLQKNARGEVFYLNAIGDMVFVK